MNHMWNYVKLGNDWYHVDVTWDDPTSDRVGYVRHKYFLCSDSQMNEGSDGHHDWEHSQKCTSTVYDGAYWKDEEKSLSAIFYIDGAEYYLRSKETGSKFSVIKRSGDTESEVYEVSAVWSTEQGGYWTGYYSGLSYYNGILYFNDTTNVYALQLGGNEPVSIYKYEGTGGVIYGSLVCDGQITLGIAGSPNEEQTLKTITLPEKSAGKITNKTSGGDAVE